MTPKKRPTATILFLAVLPVGAWVALLYFVLILVEASVSVLEYFVQVTGRL